MTRSEYSRLRKIAQARSKRLVEAGFKGASAFPKLKELGEKDIDKAGKKIEKWLAKPTSTVKGARLERERKNERARERYAEAKERITPEGKEAIKRAREAGVTWVTIYNVGEYLALSNRERGHLKAAATLGLKLNIKDAEAFGEYVDYRYSQTQASEHYYFDKWMEDYLDLIENDLTADDIKEDFELYKEDRAKLEIGEKQGGTTKEDFDEAFSRLVAARIKKKRR